MWHDFLNKGKRVISILVAICLTTVMTPAQAFAGYGDDVYIADPWCIPFDGCYTTEVEVPPPPPKITSWENSRPAAITINNSGFDQKNLDAIGKSMDAIAFCGINWYDNGVFGEASTPGSFYDWASGNVGMTGMPAPMVAVLFGTLGAVGHWADKHSTKLDYMHDAVYTMGDYCACSDGTWGMWSDSSGTGNLSPKILQAQAALADLRDGLYNHRYTMEEVAYVAQQMNFPLSVLRLDGIGEHEPIVNIEDGLYTAGKVTWGRGAVIATDASTVYKLDQAHKNGDAIAAVDALAGVSLSHVNYFNTNYDKSWVLKDNPQKSWTPRYFGFAYVPGDEVGSHITSNYVNDIWKDVVDVGATHSVTTSEVLSTWTGYVYKGAKQTQTNYDGVVADRE